MGLIKRDGAEIAGVLIQPTYAKIIDISWAMVGESTDFANITFGLSNSRANLDEGKVLTFKHASFSLDRTRDQILAERKQNRKETSKCLK